MPIVNFRCRDGFCLSFCFLFKEEDEAEDPLAIEEDDSVLEGSVTESSLIEAPDDDSSTPAKVTKLVQV